MSTDSDNQGDFVRALARGLAVIECFEGEPQPLALAEVARRTDLARGSARRLLLTLQQLGYISQTSGRFRLTSRTLNLGHAYISSNPIASMADEILREVAEQLGESCSLAELDGQNIVYLARVSSRRLIKDYVEIGRRMPAFPTSMGRILLAELNDPELRRWLDRAEIVKLAPATVLDRDQIYSIIRTARARGYATSDEEIEPARRAVAVAVRAGGGHAVAAINVSAASGSATCEELAARAVPLLERAAGRFARMIAFSGGRLR